MSTWENVGRDPADRARASAANCAHVRARLRSREPEFAAALSLAEIRLNGYAVGQFGKWLIETVASLLIP